MVDDFPDSVKREAFERSGHRCECERTNHRHFGRCSNTFWLRSEARFHRINQSGPSIVSICEVLCIDCLEKTES